MHGDHSDEDLHRHDRNRRLRYWAHRMLIRHARLGNSGKPGRQFVYLLVLTNTNTNTNTGNPISFGLA
jgi:hypothetical protein